MRIVDPLDDLCDGKTCLPYAGDTILFFDTNHMSEQGIGWLIPRHRADFDWLVGAGGS